MNLYIPMLIVVLSNTLYHICTKSTPETVNTFASLSVTYLIGALLCAALYFATRKVGTFPQELGRLNWTSYALGLAIVGLEGGYILMYKVGWSVSTAQLVQSAFLAIVLLIVGFFLYKEAITPRKLLGIAVCMAGLYLLNQ